MANEESQVQVTDGALQTLLEYLLTKDQDSSIRPTYKEQPSKVTAP